MSVSVLPTLDETLLTTWLDTHYGMTLKTFSALPVRRGRAYFRLTDSKDEPLLLVVQAQPFPRDFIKTWQALYYDYGIRQLQKPPIRAKTGSYDTPLEGAHALLLPDIVGKPAATLALDEGQRKQIGMMLAKLHGCKLLNEERLPQESFSNPFDDAWQAIAALMPATAPASLATAPASLATTPASLATTPAPIDTSTLEDTQPSAAITIDDQPTEKLVTLSNPAEPLKSPLASVPTPSTASLATTPASEDMPPASQDTPPAPQAPTHPLAAHWDALRAYYAEFVAACQQHSTNAALRKRFVACHADVNSQTLLQNADAQWRLLLCDTLMLAPAERDIYQLAPLDEYLIGYRRLHEGFMPDEALLAYYRQRDALEALFALLQASPPDADAIGAWCAQHLQPNSCHTNAAT